MHSKGIKAHKTVRQIFAVPLLIGVLSSIGLVAALVGDGWWDGVAWLTLALPVILFLILIAYRMIAKSSP